MSANDTIRAFVFCHICENLFKALAHEHSLVELQNDFFIFLDFNSRSNLAIYLMTLARRQYGCLKASHNEIKRPDYLLGRYGRRGTFSRWLRDAEPFLLFHFFETTCLQLLELSDRDFQLNKSCGSQYDTNG